MQAENTDIQDRLHHLETLDLAALTLEIFLDDPAANWPQKTPAEQLSTDGSLEDILRDFRMAWPFFLCRVYGDTTFSDRKGSLTGFDPATQRLEVQLSFVGNDTIQELNRTYRHKDEATDVLSFCQWEDFSENSALMRLPLIQLGEIFVSLEWAKDHAIKEKQNFNRYVLERVIHGFLHLSGIHHGTMEAYEQVVLVQQNILDDVFGKA